MRRVPLSRLIVFTVIFLLGLEETHQPGDKVTVTVYGGGKAVNITVTVGEQ